MKKSKPMFSLKTYLLQKAHRRLALAQFRQEKRDKKAEALLGKKKPVAEPETLIEVQEGEE